MLAMIPTPRPSRPVTKTLPALSVRPKNLAAQTAFFSGGRNSTTRCVSKEMISSPIGFTHLVHASDVAQAEVLLKRWGPDGMGKLGDPDWADPIKEVVRAQMQARAIAEVVSNMRPSDIHAGGPKPQLRVVNGNSSLTTSTVPHPVPDKETTGIRSIDGLPQAPEERGAANLPDISSGYVNVSSEFFRESPRRIVPSLITLEKAVSARIYFEGIYFPLLRQPPSREQRRIALENDLERFRISESEKQLLREKWKKNETDYLRERRRKIDVSAFVRLKTIGHGAFGVVFLVREKSTGQLYAMKQMRKTDMLKKGQEGHVRAERDVLKSAALSGASRRTDWIVRLFYSFQDQDSLYLVMEYMSGGDLLNLLIERDVFDEDFTRFYVAEMVLAIEQCHKHGFIHRDVKPDNFLFDCEGHLKLSDFGLATDLHWAHETSYYQQQRQDLLKKYGIDLADGNDYVDGRANRKLDPREVESIMGGAGKEGIFTLREKQSRKKLAYSICGTNSYMSPEVIRGQGYTYSCDWWSLGVIMFECLYGYPPFISKSRHLTRQKILSWRKSLRFPVRPRASREAVDLMQKLLCEPEDRLGAPKRVPGSTSSSLAGLNRRSGIFYQPSLGNSDGADQIKAHPWFRTINWANIRNQKAPFRPDLRSPDDTRHFDPNIEPEPLPAANGATPDATQDPWLRDRIYGAEVLGIRKAYAFAGFTHKSPKPMDYRPNVRDSRLWIDGDRGRSTIRYSGHGMGRAMSM